MDGTGKNKRIRGSQNLKKQLLEGHVPNWRLTFHRDTKKANKR